MATTAKKSASEKSASKKSAARKKAASKSVSRSSRVGLEPDSLTVRAYQVGFGDCFLLTFNYSNAKKESEKKRHILIDFGSTGRPDGTPPDQMMRVAKDIERQCRGENNEKKGKLHIVVATHRHKDHISGFSTDGDGTGEIIRALEPEVVIQPWTEKPDAKDPKIDGTKRVVAKSLQLSKEDFADDSSRAFMSVLSDMNAFSEALLGELQFLNGSGKFKAGLRSDTGSQIEFLANDNALPNRSAVENLATIAKRREYVSYGSELNLDGLLPGVKVLVLGPPTLDQHSEIQKERARDKDEFWMLQAATANFWGVQAANRSLVSSFNAGHAELFPDAEPFRSTIPSHMRWFVRQMRAARGEQLLGLVRMLDKAMNNTSVILLLEVAGKKLLFPGDAQIENWEYALGKDEDLAILKGVDLYKVGHHGSRNATPKTLWNNFDHKTEGKNDPKRLKTIVSTMAGKHGKAASHSEVPRTTLVKALEDLSDYQTTQTAASTDELFIDLPIKLRSGR
jgi:hypothetical protein